MVALYVDDLIIACSHPKGYQRLEAEFQRRYSMKILGPLKHILGMDVHYDIHNHAIHLSQSMYIKTYNKYGPNGKLKPYSTLMDSRVPYS